jgi:aminopeptidase N
MTFRSFCRVLFCVVIGASSGVIAQPVTPVLFESHNIHLKLDVPAHLAEIQDSGRMEFRKGWNLFFVNRIAKLDSIMLDGKLADHLTFALQDTANIPPDIRSGLPKLEDRQGAKLVFIKADKTDTADFWIGYRAVFQDAVENVRFSRETVGQEVAGTILDKGAYLSASSYFYPQGEDALAKYRVTADIPSAWEAICDGNETSNSTQGGRRVQSFENPFLSDGCTFMAAPYAVKTAAAGAVQVACYFFPEDTGLFQNYLAATSKYITMYSDLIGPYPYKCFTVAENFFPTGYGMPAWTLLGQSVLRLPFIVSTSLGHECLHNWWGNSVYVDYTRGNWCEAATTYGADYHYKQMESADAARDYRKDILKQYVSYVSTDKDFPIRDFKSRTSTNTRVIGYNKAMMVYDMIDQEIGDKAFFDAWKLIYKQDIGKKISWEEWIKAFEQTSGRDLSYVIPQWIDRAGAPVLGLQITSVSPGATSVDRIAHLKITETSGEKYTLRVPVRVTGPDILIDTTVLVQSPELAFDLVVPNAATTIAVDPDYHIFRRLYPEEVEPIVSGILGTPGKVFVSYAFDASSSTAFKTFGDNLAEDTIRLTPAGSLDSVSHDDAPVLLNPARLPDYISEHLTVTGDSVSIGKASYAKSGHTFVLTGQNWNGFGKYLVILTDDASALPRLGELVPHYGKYSYLVFDGTRNVGKGQWEVTSSPLKQALPK